MDEILKELLSQQPSSIEGKLMVILLKLQQLDKVADKTDATASELNTLKNDFTNLIKDLDNHTRCKACELWTRIQDEELIEKVKLNTEFRVNYIAARAQKKNFFYEHVWELVFGFAGAMLLILVQKYFGL
jgi:hypothetical protein